MSVGNVIVDGFVPSLSQIKLLYTSSSISNKVFKLLLILSVIDIFYTDAATDTVAVTTSLVPDPVFANSLSEIGTFDAGVFTIKS